MEVGAYMATLRQRRGLSQAEVAQRARARRPAVPGVVQTTISKWERGVYIPDAEQLEAWLVALDATPEERLAALDNERRAA